jgi:hypothetical protein
VLEFDAEGKLMAIRQDAAHERPKHRLLGIGMWEHEPVDLQQNRVLLTAATVGQPVQQLIEPDVVAFLAGKDTRAPTHLRDGLMR